MKNKSKKKHNNKQIKFFDSCVDTMSELMDSNHIKVSKKEQNRKNPKKKQRERKKERERDREKKERKIQSMYS